MIFIIVTGLQNKEEMFIRLYKHLYDKMSANIKAEKAVSTQIS